MKMKKQIAVICLIVFLGIIVFWKGSQKDLIRQLRGPTEGTDGVITSGDKLAVVSKSNHIYTWQWGNLSIWPTVAKLQAQAAAPLANDKIVYVPSDNTGKLIITNLKANEELTSLSLSYGAECEKIKTSSNGKFGAASIIFKQGTQKGWLKIAVFDTDLKGLPFVFQKDTNAENFLLYDFDVTGDGNLLAGAGEKNHAWIFVSDTKNENIVWEKTFDEYGQFTSVGFSPDGKRLLVAEKIRYILVFDTASGQLLNTFVMNEYQTPAHQKQNISCMAISPDSKILAADTEPAGIVWFWDIERGKKIASFRVSNLTISDIVFSPDSKYLATGCLVSPEIKIWKVPQLKP